MKNLITICLLIVQFNSAAQPPNNAIFNGGIADGWNYNNYTAATNNVFLGGSGDGFGYNSFAVATNSIFVGGNGDGWHNSSFNPAYNSIYKGAAGDGWAYTSFNPAPNYIYAGGMGDGWSFNNFALPPNFIFIGGDGDGWANIIYPLGPLPVTLLSFSGQQQGKTNLLKWKTSQELNTSYFELERSNNANSYSVIKSVQAAGNSNISKNYLSVDEHPFNGNNFYRLKMIDKDGRFTYSNVVLLKVIAGDISLSVFPNPTAEKLNIALNSNGNIAEIRLAVFDNSGKLVAQQTITNSNGAALDVSNYASGMYLLKIYYNEKVETIRFVKSK